MGPKKLERQKARELRLEGLSVNKIAELLSVAKSSVSLWVRDIRLPEKQKIIKPEKKVKVLKERLLSGDGRWMIQKPEGYLGKAYILGKYIYEHRYILEQKLGRLLEEGEVAHHIDGNKMNNHPDNLEVLSVSEHIKHHHKGRKNPDEHGTLTSYKYCRCDLCRKAYNEHSRNYKRKWREKKRQMS